MSERQRPTREQLTRAVQDRGLKTLLDESAVFRRFILDVFTDAGLFVPTHSRRSPYDTAYEEGRRALGLEVLHRLKHVRPDILGLIEREGNLLQTVRRSADASAPESEDPHEDLSYDDDQPAGVDGT